MKMKPDYVGWIFVAILVAITLLGLAFNAGVPDFQTPGRAGQNTRY